MRQLIIAYVPVLHAGYLRLFEEHQGDIVLIDPSIVPGIEYLNRDIRALPVEIMLEVIRSVFPPSPGRFVDVMTRQFVPHVLAEEVHVVMPDEDVSRELHTQCFPDKKVQFVQIFLRWHWSNVKKSVDISPDRQVTHEVLYQDLMREAQQISLMSPDWWRQIGALLIRDGKVLITGYNRHFPSQQVSYVVGDPRTVFGPGESIEISLSHHGEKEIIVHAARKGIATEGAHILVTTFPCPGCAMDIASAGISRVYYSEGYSLVDAEGILRSRGVEIVQVV